MNTTITINDVIKKPVEEINQELKNFQLEHPGKVGEIGRISVSLLSDKNKCQTLGIDYINLPGIECKRADYAALVYVRDGIFLL